MDKIKCQVPAEEYKKECEYFECEPVDFFGGYVPMEKEADDNFSKVKENIKERFNLEIKE